MRTKMNKYKEALDRIKKFKYRINSWEYSLGENVRKETDILQELVDKATPMKNTNWECPVCGGFTVVVCDIADDVRKHNFCPDCGQAIDWSKE